MKINEALSYDSETGIIRWLVGRSTHVKNKIAGWVDRNGYRCIIFDGISYKAHHIAWRLFYGEWPAQIVDHKNRIKTDNRINNLRLATKQQNNVNTKRTIRGVYKHGNKWKAQLRANGKTEYLGLYLTKEEAYAVVRIRHKELHGEFSPCE